MIHCGEYNKTVDDKIMPHRLYYLRTPLVTVTDYDPHWPEQFELLRKHLRPLLEKFNCRLEHVGSTAVPGLAAKPVIDADCILSDGSQWPAVREALERFGFFHRGDGGLKGREMFTETLALPFRHNFYVCLPESLHLANHLKLRDYLRETPEAAHHYGALKRRLAERFPDDVDSYCAGKSGLLAEFLQAAGMPLRRWRRSADSIEPPERPEPLSPAPSPTADPMVSQQAPYHPVPGGSPGFYRTFPLSPEMEWIRYSPVL